MSENQKEIDAEAALFYAEQQLRYFMRRDEMNAEVHLNTPVDLRLRDNRVRYSPITYAAQMLVSYLSKQI